MKRGLLFIGVACGCAVVLVLFVVKNYHHGGDELHSRALWSRQNGKMLDFVRDHVAPGAKVFQFNDDPECAVTFRTYINGVCDKGADWHSLPMNVPRVGGKWDPANRSVGEIHQLFSKVQPGDMLLVPVTRANVSYIRMPLYTQASQLFPKIVPPALQKRLRRIYSEYELFKHTSIPPHIESYLVTNKRADVLKSLRTSGMQLGFGWQVYQVQ